MSENWFRYKDEQGREAEVKIPSHDPTAIASFREFIGAIQEGRQQDWNNQMQSIEVWKSSSSQLALRQSQPLQLPPAQSVPAAASFPKYPEPIYQPNPYAHLEVGLASQPTTLQQEPVYRQPVTVDTYQDLYQLNDLIEDDEAQEIFDRPLWLRLLINPLSLSLSLSLVLGGLAWFAIDVIKTSTSPKPTPAPAVQVAPTPATPASPQPQQPAPVAPKTSNQLQVAPSTPPPPPN